MSKITFLSLTKFSPSAKKIKRYVRYMRCAFLLWVGLSCLQASQMHINEEVKSQSMSSANLLKSSEDAMRDDVAHFFEKMHVVELGYPRYVVIKALLDKHPLGSALLKHIAKEGYGKKLKNALVVYQLIEELMDSDDAPSQEKIKILLEIYGNILRHAFSMIDRNQKKRHVTFLLRHLVAMLTHEKHGKTLQNHTLYMAFWKPYVTMILRDKNLRTSIPYLPCNGQGIAALAHPSLLDKKADKTLLLDCLHQKMNLLASSKDTATLEAHLKVFLHFKELFQVNENSDAQALKKATIELKKIQRHFETIIKRYEDAPRTNLRLGTIYPSETILTYVRILASHDLGKKMALQQFFCWADQLDILAQKEMVQIIFEEGNEYNQDDLYEAIKDYALLQNPFLIGERTLQPNPTQCSLGFHHMYVALTDDSLNRLSQDEELAIQLQLKNDGTFLVKKNASQGPLNRASLTHYWHEQVRILSFEYKLASFLKKIENNMNPIDLEDALKGIEHAITNSPSPNIAHNDLAVMGYLRGSKVSNAFLLKFPSLIKKYYGEGNLISLRYLKFMELLHTLYRKNNMMLRQMSLSTLNYLNVKELMRYDCPATIRHAIWEEGTTMYNDNLKKGSPFFMQKNTLYAFSKFPGFGKPTDLIPKSMFVRDIPCMQAKGKKTIEKFFKNWWQCVYDHQLLQPCFLMVGMECFRTFTKTLEVHPLYQAYIFAALKEMVNAPHARKYIFHYLPTVFNALSAVYQEEANQFILKAARDMLQDHQYTREEKHQMLQWLARFKFKVKHVVHFFFNQVEKKGGSLVCAFLAKWLVMEEQEDDFIVALDQQDKVDHFLSFCKDHREELQWQPCSQVFFPLEAQIKTHQQLQ